MLALIGPNGAGKTSTIMAIMGHTTVHQGRILFAGRDITYARPVARAPLGIALVPEGRRLFPDLTVEENLTVGGYCRSMARDKINRERVYEAFPRLGERRRQSGGIALGRRAADARHGPCALAEPRLLLIDELSLGLMPKVVDLCFEVIERLRRDGLTIVLVEQNTTRALEFADAVCILASGSAVFFGPAAAARADPQLFERYFGTQ